MKSKKSAILLSAFVFPGIGQLVLGKKRGFIIIAVAIVLLGVLTYGVVRIIVEEVSPDILLNVNVFEIMGRYLNIRTRVLAENAIVIFSVLAVWLGSLIDTILIRVPDEKDGKSETIPPKP